MPNGQINPLAAPLQALKQFGEQANMGIQSLGTGLAQTTSQALDTIMAAAPPIPGVPGAAARGAPGLPSLMPAQLTQALTQVENVIIPQGLPRPSQFLGAPAPAPAAQPPAPAQATAPPAAPRATVTPTVKIGGY